jgi:hypothetical protein
MNHYDHHTDLRTHANAHAYVKEEVVQVRFAKQAGAVQSREGLNHYAIGDALITGSTGDHWSVSRARFDAKYESLPGIAHGADGAYTNKPVPILAVQQTGDFTVEREAGGDIIHGKAGDWLMQYAPGDHGIVENAKFQKVYRSTR